MAESIVIYFSRDGSTAALAGLIAEKTGSAILELKEEKPRRGFLISGYRSASGRRPDLAGDPWAAMEGKETVILGAPIWAGNGNPVLNSFLDKANLKGKKVILFSVQADPALKSARKVLARTGEAVKACGGELLDSRGFHGDSPGKTATEEYMRGQLEGWQIRI